jgi:hypothetical protein
VLPLLVLLLIVAIGAVERHLAGARNDAERRHLLALLMAAGVSPAAAAVAAAAPVEREPREAKPVQAM